MKKRCFNAVISTALLAFTTYAHAYFVQTGLNSSYSRSTTDSAIYYNYSIVKDKVKLTDIFYQADVQVFFKDVSIKSGPLQEAAFLDKAGSASFSYTYDKLNYDTGITGDTTTDILDTAIRAVVGPVILEASLQNVDRKQLHYNYKTYETGIGGYLTNTQELVFSIGDIHDDHNDTVYGKFRYKGIFTIGKLFLSPYTETRYSRHKTDYNNVKDYRYSHGIGILLYPLDNFGIGPEIQYIRTNYGFYNEGHANAANIFLHLSYMPTTFIVMDFNLQHSSSEEDLEYNSMYQEKYESKGYGVSSSIHFRF